MTKAKLFLAFLAIISTTTITAQTKFTVPQNVVLVAKEDYAKYETDIINAAKWLEQTDLDGKEDKRKEVSKFVVEWLTGSPTVTLTFTESLTKLYGKNTALLTIYIGSYCREYLEHKTTATVFSAAKAGVTSMMNVYKKDIEIKKCKEMDKVIKLADDGKLDDYIKDKFKE